MSSEPARLAHLQGILSVLAWHEMTPEPGHLWSEFRATIQPLPSDPATVLRATWPEWAEGCEVPNGWFITPLDDWETSFRRSVIYWAFRRMDGLTFYPVGSHRERFLDCMIEASETGVEFVEPEPVPIILPEPPPLKDAIQRHRERLVEMVLNAVLKMGTSSEAWHYIQSGYKITKEVFGFVLSDKFLLIEFEATE